MESIRIPNFDLRTTLESGQVFRFDEVDGRTSLRVRGRILNLRQEGDCLEFDGADRRFVEDYFQLDVDLEWIHRELSRDARLRPILKQFPGLRILRQDPWECLVTFICSSASNIPGIRRRVEALCALYGRPMSLGDRTVYDFPDPGDLCSESEMRAKGLGFRARFLAQLNPISRRLGFARLRQSSYREAKSALMELPGVGDKVADCVLLFALGHGQAFPVDVWIKRTMESYYFGGRKATIREIHDLAHARFGVWAGYAQQYIFHHARLRNRSHE